MKPAFEIKSARTDALAVYLHNADSTALDAALAKCAAQYRELNLPLILDMQDFRPSEADLPAVLAQMPQVSRIGTTGGKATEILIGKLPQKTKLPKTGETVPYPCGERSLQLTRLPSTSRAYPLALDKKAEAYRAFFHAAGLV